MSLPKKDVDDSQPTTTVYVQNLMEVSSTSQRLPLGNITNGRITTGVELTTTSTNRTGEVIANPCRRSARLSANASESDVIATIQPMKQRQLRKTSEEVTIDTTTIEVPKYENKTKNNRHTNCVLRRSRSESIGNQEDGSIIGHKIEMRLLKRFRPDPIEAQAIETDRLCCDEESIYDSEVESQNGSFDGVIEEAHHNLVRTPFDDSKYTVGISVYDTPSKGKVLEAPEYVTDIFQRLYNCETIHLLQPYMSRQTKINNAMRSILVDWIIEVHKKFQLEQETLYLCVNILDRYLSSVIVERSQLQLVGVTSLLLASKYEESYAPEVKDCVYITDRAYTHQEVLDMEAAILRELNFNLSVPTALPFLHRFLFLTQATETMKYASNYYLDRVLQEHDSLKFRPSVLASAVVCLAINQPEIREMDDLDVANPGIPAVLLEYTGFTRESILEAATFVAAKVAIEVQTVNRRELVAVVRKYEYSRFLFVSSDFDPPTVDALE